MTCKNTEISVLIITFIFLTFLKKINRTMKQIIQLTDAVAYFDIDKWYVIVLIRMLPILLVTLKKKTRNDYSYLALYLFWIKSWVYERKMRNAYRRNAYSERIFSKEEMLKLCWFSKRTQVN